MCVSMCVCVCVIYVKLVQIAAFFRPLVPVTRSLKSSIVSFLLRIEGLYASERVFVQEINSCN